MRVAEMLSLAYFTYLPVAGWLSGSRMRPGWPEVACGALAGVAWGLHLVVSGWVGGEIRNWAPGAFLILAYWMSKPYLGRLRPGMERRLLAVDCRLFGHGLKGLAERAPRGVLEALELAYLSCYAFVPAGLVVLALSGNAASADRYWTAVLTAALPCYGLLPWIHTRPPRCVEHDPPIDRRRLAFRRINRAVLANASVHANTFPSAHVAASLPAALMVASSALPWAGAVFLALAAAITIGAVAGRYHYGADALLGALLGVLGFLAGSF